MCLCLPFFSLILELVRAGLRWRDWLFGDGWWFGDQEWLAIPVANLQKVRKTDVIPGHLLWTGGTNVQYKMTGSINYFHSAFTCVALNHCQCLLFLGDFIISVFSITFIGSQQCDTVGGGETSRHSLALLCLSRVGRSLSMKAN